MTLTWSRPWTDEDQRFVDRVRKQIRAERLERARRRRVAQLIARRNRRRARKASHERVVDDRDGRHWTCTVHGVESYMSWTADA